MINELDVPILQDGLRNTHFFNGRILTGDDLQNEQQANRTRFLQLGQNLGEGVLSGLIVRNGATGKNPTLRISAGQALNRKGQVIHLPKDVEVGIVREKTIRLAQSPGLFAECAPSDPSSSPTGTGVYLLLIAPASGYQERVSKVGLDDKGVASQCNHKYAVEGVQFRLVHLDLNNKALVPSALLAAIKPLLSVAQPDTAQRSMVRNLLAHWCLGTVEKASFRADLYSLLAKEEVTYGPLDVLREGAEPTIRACDVPLGIIYWTKNQVEFVDRWAVRRRVHRLASTDHPPFPATDRAEAEAEAAFQQFQEHYAETERGLLSSRIQRISMVAQTHFRFLPSVGVVPVSIHDDGQDNLTFFRGLTYRAPLFMEGVKIPSLVKQAFSYAPVDLTSGEMLWLYQVRENRQPLVQGARTAQPYLIFANGHMPFEGEAQYNLSRWNYSHYSSLLDE